MTPFLSKHINSNISVNPSNKILLVQLSSNGDCLYVTTIAHQIKIDYPNCHLTWAIGSMYRSILDGNPHVDEVWEIPFAKPSDIVSAWHMFNDQLKGRQAREEFDQIFITQMEPFRYDGTIRSSTFSGYPNPITVPISPIVRLFPNEIENVRQFAEYHNLKTRDMVILIECSVKSEQSFITPDFAMQIAVMIVNSFQQSSVILSSNIPIVSNDKRIIDGSILTFRENAELTKYCSFLIGGSSGITWISTSDWAKPLPTIQLINPDALWFASVVYDYNYWGLSTDHIIEMTPCHAHQVFDCFAMCVNEDLRTAKAIYHVIISPNFKGYQQFQYEYLIKYQFKNAYMVLRNTMLRNGFTFVLLIYLLSNLGRFFAVKFIPPILIDFIKYSQKILAI